jgi:hypothetical protein
MNPQDVLLTLAQLGVAVPGFSGIVVVLGERARNATALGNAFLDVLLYGGIGVVLWALVPLVLLSAQLPTETVWIASSAGWSIQQVLIIVLRAYQVRHTSTQTSRPDTVFLAFVFLGGTILLALQIANVVWLASAWPHLAGLVWWLMLSLVVFLRLMRASRGEG